MERGIITQTGRDKCLEKYIFLLLKKTLPITVTVYGNDLRERTYLRERTNLLERIP